MLDPDLLQAFVISLPRAEARRRHILSCLEGQVQAHVVVAENGREWSAGELRRYAPDPYCMRHRRMLEPTEVACAVSHRKAMRAFLETGARYGLILEDDATVTPEALRTLGRLLATLPEMQLLKLCGRNSPVIGRGLVHGTVDGVTVMRVVTLGDHAHGYVVSRSGAERFSRVIVPVNTPVDLLWRHSWAHGCEIYESSPWLVWLTDASHVSSISDDPNRGWRGKAPVRRWPAYLAFRMRSSIGRWSDRWRRFGPRFLFSRRGMVSGLPSGESEDHRGA